MALADSTTPEPSDAPPAASYAKWLQSGWAWLALAAVVRFIYLGRADISADEILFINHSGMASSPLAVLSSLYENAASVGRLPAGPMLQNLWFKVAGVFNSEFAENAVWQRLPALAWSSATVPLAYFLAKRLLNQRAALYVGCFMTFLFFPMLQGRLASLYAPLMFFSMASLYLFYRVLDAGTLSRKTGALLFVSMMACALTDRLGVGVPITLWLLCTFALMFNRFDETTDRDAMRKVGLRLWLLAVGVLAVVSPFYFKIMFNPSAERSTDLVAGGALFNDFLAKLLVGSSLPGTVLAWALFGFGCWHLGRKASSYPQKALVAWVGVGAILVIFIDGKAQLPAQHLAVLAPWVYLVLAAGVIEAAAWISSKVGSAEKTPLLCERSIVGVVLGVTLILFLPLLYTSRAWSQDFGSMARWLNEHGIAGNPYVFESGYDHRWVPGYYKTPGLIGAAPYIHGAGTTEMLKLRERQRLFFQEFPEAFYIEASRHGILPGSSYGPWEWPRQFFRQEAVVENVPLTKLYRRGIWPAWSRNNPQADAYLKTPILYNTPQDIEQVWRQSGQSILFTYNGWRCVKVSDFTYARASSTPRGDVQIRNLHGGELKGKFVVVGALLGPERSYKLTLALDGQELASDTKWPGLLWTWETEGGSIGPGDHVLTIQVDEGNAPDLQGLIVRGIRFEPQL